MRTTRRILHAVAPLAGAAVLLAVKAACSQGHRPPPVAPVAAKPVGHAQFDLARPAHLEFLGTPLKSARTWATALAPNSRGGWNFITQSFELFSTTPTELIVVDLETGKTTITQGKPGIYTGARYTYENELRAQNGRIFFPESQASVAYYDPADESVHELGNLIDPPGPTKSFYKGTFGPDGMLYLGSQTYKLPTIVQLDPATLKSKIIGEVGKTRIGYSFAHDFVVDPPWIYVAVGENPWELAALDMRTGQQTILETRADNGWMKLEAKPEGALATLTSGKGTAKERHEQFWLIDGKTIPFDATKIPFKPHNLPKLRAMPTAPPELDLTNLNPDDSGTGHIKWRPAGTTAWRETTFKVNNTFPITLESLIALPAGGLLGNGVQYHGFFHFDPATRQIDELGAHGPSRPVHAIVNGIVYITGYPNGLLYAFDPTKPWHSTGKDKEDLKDPASNPQVLGTFAPSRTKYAVVMQPSTHNRLYYAGRRERDGVGGGVAYYDIATKDFHGHAKNLELLNPDGLAVLDGIGLVVYSGHLPPVAPKQGLAPVQAEAMPNEAPLVVYDLELNELARLVVKPGLRDTGVLFRTPDPNVVIGVVAKENLIYRYDITHKKLLAERPLDGAIEDVTQDPTDLAIWVTGRMGLEQIDPTTLVPTRIAGPEILPEKATNLEWQGGALYLTAKGDLYRIVNDNP